MGCVLVHGDQRPTEVESFMQEEANRVTKERARSSKQQAHRLCGGQGNKAMLITKELDTTDW
jgi:hypothetical protein